MPRIKYRDDMTEAEREQFCAELEAIDSAYSRAGAEERRTRMIFNLVGCLADAIECIGRPEDASIARYREVLAEAEAMGYPVLTDEDVGREYDELRKAALSRGQP